VNGYRILLSLAVCLATWLLPANGFAQSGNHPALDAKGFQQHRDYFSEMPFENIDTMGGGLVLTFTDLVLPRHAGRELRFQRTYNSKNGAWYFGIVGIPLRITNPAIPTVLDSPVFQFGTPALHMSDGSVRKMAWYESPNINDPSSFNEAISSEFWRFNRAGATRRLSFPNGDTCDYEVDSTDLLRVKKCEDIFGNDTDFDWQMSGSPPGLSLQITSEGRVINVEFGPGSVYPTSMTHDGHTWAYTSTSVTPPVGAGWSFSYDGLLLTSLTTPHGGVIEYTYDEVEYEGPDSPNTQYKTTVVGERETSGPGITAGIWSYEYAIGQDGLSSETAVEPPTPSGQSPRRVLYTHGLPVAEDPQSYFDGIGGLVPLRSRTIQEYVGSTWVDREVEEREYELLSVLPWWTFGTLELIERTVTRYDGSTPTSYTTTLEYHDDDIAGAFADFHNPWRTTETGTAGERITERAFQHSDTPYILALPVTESVLVGVETFTKSAAYNGNGFKTSETAYGITTLFEPDPYGNVRLVTKANGKTTLFQYQHGQPKAIVTPAYAITRAINPDGSVASETRAGRTFTFGYDDLGRPETAQPPGGVNATHIDYDEDGEWVRTTRGTSQITATFDGFGRRVHTINAVNVQSTISYDAEGRVVYEGYPFRTGDASGGSDIGAAIKHDALGRVTERLNPDGSKSTRTYGPGGTVTVVEEHNPDPARTTVLTWQAFGNPDEPRLASTTDAEGRVWTYSYNALGRLARVTAEDAIEREWSIDGRNLVVAETHPESGTTQFTYDAAGVLQTKTDANGTVTAYTYDGNDRVRTITAGGLVTAIAYAPGSDDRETAVNASSGVIWRYDPATGRLRQRQDAIGGKLFTTMFEYDNNDNLSALVYPSGRRVQYAVNAEGQTTRVYEPSVPRDYAASVTYHASGGVKSYSASNGTTTTIDYDPARYWVTGIDSGPLQLTYSNYDGVGNPRAIGDSRSGFDQTLAYDGLDRLIAAAGAYGVTAYSYDLHGNRIGTGYQYQSGTLRLSNQNGTAFTYDNNGNTLTAGSATYTYTPQNQVATSANLGVSANYAYDADEQRVSKTTAGSTTYYIRGPGGELLTEWTDPGTSTGIVRDYINMGSRLLSAVTKTTADDPGGYNVPQTQSHRMAKSWQAVLGFGSGAASLYEGVTAAARKSSHPDMPRTGLRVGLAAGTVDHISLGPFLGNNTEHAKQGGLFFEFEVERYPFSTDTEWLGVDGAGSGSNGADALRMYITSGGYMVLKHDGGRTTPQTLWTSSSPMGLRTRHTLELRFEFNSYSGPYASPNPVWENLTSWAQVYFDGVVVATYLADGTESNPLGLDVKNGLTYYGSAEVKSPAATNGLLMNLSRLGATAATNHGDPFDPYGTAWRTTLLEAAGTGTHTQWTGGQPDWRARSAMPRTATGGGAPLVSTNVSGNKISYVMEPMVSRGITGSIGAVMVGVRMGTVSANTRAFIRRNGVETPITALTLTSNDYRWYRVAASGWAATDTIEIGVTCGDNSTNSLSALALLVEHDTPEPAPLTDTAARVVTVNYTGNGGAQTIDFGGLDLVPTVLYVVPLDSPTSVEPLAWWDSRLGTAGMAEVVTSYGLVWPQKGKFHLVHSTSAPGSYNANGVNYVAIALFDPAGRYAIPFAVSTPTGEDNYVHELRNPQGGEPASGFTPDFVFGGVASRQAASATAGASVYRGPGHAGDLTSKLGVSGSQSTAEADRIQALGAGTVEFGTLVGGYQNGDQSFWAGRVDDGTSTTRLMAVTSYVGDGTPSRNITLNLSGEAPVFAIVVPTNASLKVYRAAGDTTGRATFSGNAVANSLTSMTADQITVGTALNATGVTYDVWAITVGFVPPIQ